MHTSASSHLSVASCWAHELRDLVLLHRQWDLLIPASIEESGESTEEAWALAFVLFTWLGVVVLVPFSLLALSDGPSLVSAFITRATHALGTSGRVRDAAALCLAHALARTDLEAQCTAFLERAPSLVCEGDVWTRLGVLTTLVRLVPRVPRSILAPRIPSLSALLDAPVPRGGGALERRWRVKLNARLAVAALLAVEDASLEEVAEARLGAVLEALRDEDTRTRESAAACVAKVAQHLASDVVSDVVDAVLALLVVREAAHTWHGALLALAHLLQRALLVRSCHSQLILLLRLTSRA